MLSMTCLNEKNKTCWCSAHFKRSWNSQIQLKKSFKSVVLKDLPVLIDGAQGAPHLPVDVTALDVDFYVFSGHKLYGPTGIGVLYGKEIITRVKCHLIKVVEI